MNCYHLVDLMNEKHYKNSDYFEFIRENAMSAGVYKLTAGSEDHQQPHTEDEIYVVLQGSAKFFNGHKDLDVHEGTILYVPAHTVHRFHHIEKDLVVLVIFAPAEHSQRNVNNTSKL